MQLRFSIQSSTHYISFLRRLVASLQNFDKDFNHESVVSCQLAIVEAVNNAIFHAHHKDVNKLIDIEIKMEKAKLIFFVDDYGDGFQMNSPHMPKISSSHGRGLFIIGSVMDEVKYTKGKVKNRMKMVFKLGVKK